MMMVKMKTVMMMMVITVMAMMTVILRKGLMQPRLALPFWFFFLHLLSARIFRAYHNRPYLCDVGIKPKALEYVGKPSTNWDVWTGRVFTPILQIQKQEAWQLSHLLGQFAY